MISQEDDDRSQRPLLWAFLASVLLHALLLPAIFASWSKSLNLAKTHPDELVLSSTALRIEPQPVPRPRARPAPAQRPAPQSVAAAAAAPAAPVAPPQRRHELARAKPNAPPQPHRSRRGKPASSLAEQLAQQQRLFSQEVARLNQEHDPLSIAPRSRRPPATYRRTYFDVPGHRQRNEIEAVLIPLRHWESGGASCYYVRYVAQYTEGGSEQGIIPWPVCYPAGQDAMVHPPYPHNLPIPVPQPSYVLPIGTYLTPLLQAIYRERPS
jgi:hypothetical protein